MSNPPKPGDRLDVGGVLCEAVEWRTFDSERIKAFAESLGKRASVCGLCPAVSAPDTPVTELCRRTPCGDRLLVPVELVGPLKLANVIRGEP